MPFRIDVVAVMLLNLHAYLIFAVFLIFGLGRAYYYDKRMKIGWEKLVAWREDSKYKWSHTQWLEENIPSDSPGIEFVLDLYLPIAK